MSREEAIEIIESLYGWEDQTVKDAVAYFGYDEDGEIKTEALVQAAEQQQAREVSYCANEAVKWA